MNIVISTLVDDPDIMSRQAQAFIEDANEEMKEQKEESQQLLENYSGLKYYLPPNTSKLEDYDKNRLHSRDTSCCTLMFLVLLLSLSCYILNGRRNVTHEFWIQNRIRSSLYKTTTSGITFDTMNDQTDFGYFLVDIVSTTFFKPENEKVSTLVESMQMVGPLRIRQSRVKKMDCPRADDFDLTNRICYHPMYNQENRDEDEISDIDIDYMKFTSASDNKIEMDVEGEFGRYDGSGYVADFPTTKYT